MIRLYSASGLHEAYILLGLLQQERIAARVLNVNAQGGLGEIPFTHVYPEIWIDDDRDAVRARGVIDAFRTAPRPEVARRCEACGEESPGNFESCWNCGAVLP